MTTFTRIDLECRPHGSRTWQETSHSTSHLPSAVQMLENQVKLHPELDWRVVAEVAKADENGKPVA